MNFTQAIQKCVEATHNAAPVVYVMVGLPGSGKSTFLKSLTEALGKLVIASTDGQIDEIAAKSGKTYTEAMKSVNFKDLTRNMDITIKQAVNREVNFAVDQTNVGAKKRMTVLSKVSDRFVKVAVVFNTNDKLVEQRLADRAAATGKFIPKHVSQDMASRWEAPSKKEGFDLIIEVD